MQKLNQKHLIFATLIVSIVIQTGFAQKAPAPVSVKVTNTASEPVPVSGTVNIGNSPSVSLIRPNTALIFQARDVSFASLNGMGAIDVGAYGTIRIVVRNSDFPVDLVVSLIEGGDAIGVLDVIEVPGCPDGGCVGTRSITRVYDVPGRSIRFSTDADPKARGDVHIFGR